MAADVKDTTVVCASCLKAGERRKLDYDLMRDFYVCVIHGPQVTEHFVRAPMRHN